jgi:hypothetical protein
VTSVEPTNPVGSVESSAHRVPAESAPDGLSQAERTYVLDTSVLLSDPRALFRFAEHAVVLPVVVITELENGGPGPEILESELITGPTEDFYNDPQLTWDDLPDEWYFFCRVHAGMNGTGSLVGDEAA